jgi:hypothetical protein
MEHKKIKIEFAPGAFDTFDGTQEELNELVAEIQKMAETGELFEKSTPVDFDELVDEDPEWAERIINSLDESPRKLQ